MNPGCDSHFVPLHQEQPVPITTKIFETLVVLVENRGRVVTEDELLLRLWPDTEANLAQNISTLWKALEDNPEDHRYIAIGGDGNYPGRQSGSHDPRVT